MYTLFLRSVFLEFLLIGYWASWSDLWIFKYFFSYQPLFWQRLIFHERFPYLYFQYMIVTLNSGSILLSRSSLFSYWRVSFIIFLFCHIDSIPSLASLGIFICFLKIILSYLLFTFYIFWGSIISCKDNLNYVSFLS